MQRGVVLLWGVLLRLEMLREVLLCCAVLLREVLLCCAVLLREIPLSLGFLVLRAMQERHRRAPPLY